MLDIQVIFIIIGLHWHLTPPSDYLMW